VAKGEAFWVVKFCRRKCQNGLYHVKIYITRKKKFAMEIEKMKTEAIQLEDILDSRGADLQEFEAMTGDLSADMKEVLGELNLCHYLLGRVDSVQLEIYRHER